MVDTRILTSSYVKDFIQLLQIFDTEFEWNDFVIPPISRLEHLLGSNNFFVVAAKKGDIVVGGLTVFVLQHYSTINPIAYLYDLAVSKSHQREGIGKKLIEYTTEYCKNLGFEELFVQVHLSDTEAIEFYRATKFDDEQSVLHFTYQLGS
ncbi:MAG: GNAT family N-acetyltransferase [Saprospiraceae bacterium]|nr:GNAT family N-acetyltransferase [Saprospiraceae bacterium]